MDLGSRRLLDKASQTDIGLSGRGGLVRPVICTTRYAIHTRAEVGPACLRRCSNGLLMKAGSPSGRRHGPRLGYRPLTLGSPAKHNTLGFLSMRL